MNKKLFITMLITIATIVSLFIMGGNSLANGDYKVNANLTTDSVLKEGQIVTINVNIDPINVGRGIDAFVAKLNYDTNVFEPITTTKFNSNTGWKTVFAPSTNMMTAVRDEKITSSETMFTIDLKVKSGINSVSTVVTLDNIEVSGGRVMDGDTGDIAVNSTSVTIYKYSVSMSLSSTSSLTEGKVVTIKANLTNIDAGKGIDALVARLNYDTNVFVPITATTSFASLTDWTTYYSSKTNMMTAVKDEKVTEPETMFILQLKVRDNIDVEETTIYLDNIEVSGGRIIDGDTGDIPVKTAAITFTKSKTYVPTAIETSNVEIPSQTVITNTQPSIANQTYTITNNEISNEATEEIIDKMDPKFYDESYSELYKELYNEFVSQYTDEGYSVKDQENVETKSNLENNVSNNVDNKQVSVTDIAQMASKAAKVTNNTTASNKTNSNPTTNNTNNNVAPIVNTETVQSDDANIELTQNNDTNDTTAQSIALTAVSTTSFASIGFILVRKLGLFI